MQNALFQNVVVLCRSSSWHRSNVSEETDLFWSEASTSVSIPAWFCPRRDFSLFLRLLPIGFAFCLVVGCNDHSSFGSLHFCPNFIVDWSVMKDRLEGYRSLSFQKQLRHLLLKESMGQKRIIRSCKWCSFTSEKEPGAMQNLCKCTWCQPKICVSILEWKDSLRKPALVARLNAWEQSKDSWDMFLSACQGSAVFVAGEESREWKKSVVECFVSRALNVS